MPTHINKTIEILKKPGVILGSFVLFKGVQTIYAFATRESFGRIPSLHLLIFSFISVASFLAIKGKKTAQWIMGCYLLAQITTVFWAISVVPTDQPLLKVSSVILSVYFVYGGLIMVRIAKEKPEG